MADDGSDDPQSEVDDPTKERVERWLQDKGVRLELTVAAEFRRYLGNPYVDHARFYVAEDVGNRKIREVDVVAQCRGVYVPTSSGSVVTWFIVECKSSKNDSWVLYRARGRSASQFVGKDERGLLRSTIRWIEHGASVDHLDAWTVGEAYRSVYVEPSSSYAYQIADTGEDPRKSNAKQSAYEAVQQVLSAVDGAAAEVLLDLAGPSLSIFVPVIVTSAPLFTVDAEDDAYTVSRASIVPLIGRFTTDTLSLIWIVQQEALADYVTTAVAGAHKLRLVGR